MRPFDRTRDLEWEKRLGMQRIGAASLVREGLRLLRPFWPTALLATAMGALAGLATARLLVMINQALHTEGGATPLLLLGFAGLCGLAVVGEIVADLGNGYVGQQVVARLRRELCDKILAAPIDQLEQFERHRLLATLNQDVDVVSGFTFAFSGPAIAFAVAVSGFAYLVALSPALALGGAVPIGLGIAIHARARRAGRAGFEAARAAQDELQRHFRTIIEGAKELRINRDRRRHVRDDQLGGTIERIRRLRLRAMRLFRSASAFSTILYFVVIGGMLALQSRFAVGGEVLSGFVLVLLYIRGPLQQVVGSLPMIGQAQVALKRLTALSTTFAASEPEVLRGDAPVPAMGAIALSGVRYAFPPSSGAAPFVLGPLDLEIRPGEILFIVGENGCGKTTLVKLLLGLYAPQEGSLSLGGVPILAENRDSYRQLFTTVFADYYLFDALIYGHALPEEALPYLERLDIAHKVTVENGHFSTVDLSTGQRKRLALVHAYLERRPIIVFDEWAADQDPAFRRLFYTELLGELKQQGKTLVVISHDDRYFEVADRVVHMRDGRITAIT